MVRNVGVKPSLRRTYRRVFQLNRNSILGSVGGEDVVSFNDEVRKVAEEILLNLPKQRLVTISP
jgi:hypothetical protein